MWPQKSCRDLDLIERTCVPLERNILYLMFVGERYFMLLSSEKCISLIRHELIRAEKKKKRKWSSRNKHQSQPEPPQHQCQIQNFCKLYNTPTPDISLEVSKPTWKRSYFGGNEHIGGLGKDIPHTLMGASSSNRFGWLKKIFRDTTQSFLMSDSYRFTSLPGFLLHPSNWRMTSSRISGSMAMPLLFSWPRCLSRIFPLINARCGCLFKKE